MRVQLTDSDLATDTGAQLLQVCVKIAEDGRLELPEIKDLRRWLLAHQTNAEISAIHYLLDIMSRITADHIIDKDELLQLHLAVERVIPTTRRTAAMLARKQREAEERARRHATRIAEREQQVQNRREDLIRANRLRYACAKVAGVIFKNDDGTERQKLIAGCKRGETLLLQHDSDNEFSIFATKVLRKDGDQLGYAPEYMAERIMDEKAAGYNAQGVLLKVTGGTFDKPIHGANFAVIFADPDVTPSEFQSYVTEVIESEWDRSE